MTFTGKVSDVSFDVITRKNKITFTINEKDVLNQLDEIKDVEKLNIEAEPYREKRSLNANAYFHVLVNKLARKLGTSDEEMKIQLNLKYGTIAVNKDGTKFGIKVPFGSNIGQFYKYCKKFGECVENGITFEKYLLYKETHTLDSKEMAQLIDGVVSDCKEQGIETKTDEELKSLLGAWKNWTIIIKIVHFLNHKPRKRNEKQ